MNPRQVCLLVVCYVGVSASLGAVLGAYIGRMKGIVSQEEYFHSYVGFGFFGAMVVPLMISGWYLVQYLSSYDTDRSWQ